MTSLGEIQEIRARVDQNPTSVEQALQQLTDIKVGMEYWGSRVREIVGFLREQGVSWAEIGDYLGVSAQAVHKRFKKGLQVGLSSSDS